MDLPEQTVSPVSTSSSDSHLRRKQIGFEWRALSADDKQKRLQALTVRCACSEEDKPPLMELRLACGWGAEYVSVRIQQAAVGEVGIYIFKDEETNTDIGMGVIETIDSHTQDVDLCNPETGTVMISGIFVYQEFQGLGIGNAMMDILENQARTVFKAHVVTVTTAAVDQDGTDSQTRMWYQRRGYKQIKESANRYPELVSCFLAKSLYSPTT